MTHEFKHLILDYAKAKAQGLKTILATVVRLEGSSYRRPGVRMLLREDGTMSGAISGGCVEKEVLRQSLPVFETGVPRLMTYDGRYRLGCEGVLYILIEPFEVEEKNLEAFYLNLKERKPFHIQSFFSLDEGDQELSSSCLTYGSNTIIPFSPTFHLDKALKNELVLFEQEMKPCFKLFIFGTEHDAVQLTQFASLTGWEVTVIGSVKDRKTLANFPGAEEILHLEPAQIPLNKIDKQSAILLMSHSYVTDLKYLMALKDVRPAYLGLLGPSRRREKLLSEFIGHFPDVQEDFFDLIHGPAGINIGAETPQEIAISIISEILSVIRQQTPMPLKEKQQSIHSGVRL